MKAEIALKYHLDLCDEAYRLLLEENHHYRQTESPVSEGFLDRKRDILPRLESSLESLRQLRQDDPLGVKRHRDLASRVQKRLMQVLTLDRENERLLLQVSVQSRPNPRRSAPSYPG